MPSRADNSVPIDAEPNPLGFSPRVFALCRTVVAEDSECEGGGSVDEADTVVVAWGMTLPEGKAMAVSPDRSMSLASSAESMAWLHGADLVWAPTA